MNETNTVSNGTQEPGGVDRQTDSQTTIARLQAECDQARYRQAQEDFRREQEARFERQWDKIEAVVENYKKEANEKIDRVVHGAREWSDGASKRIEWSIHVIIALVAIATILGATIIFKSYIDEEKIRQEVNNNIENLRARSSEATEHIKSIENLKNEISKAHDDIVQFRNDLYKTNSTNVSPQERLDPANKAMAEKVATQDRDRGAKFTAEAQLAQSAQKWEEAIAAWNKVLEQTPDSIVALTSIAYSEWQLSRSTPAIEKRNVLLVHAKEHCEKVLAEDFQNPAALRLLGITLSYFADPAITKRPDERNSYLKKAIENFKESSSLKQDCYTFNGWGYSLIALSDPALGHPLEERTSYLAEAGEKFERAIAIKKDFPAPYAYGSMSLNLLADKTITPDHAKRKEYLRESEKKCKEAFGIRPSYSLANNSLAGALLGRAIIAKEEGDEPRAKELLQEARNKCIAAKESDPMLGAYNLALVSAMQGDKGECRRWLEYCRDKHILPSYGYLNSDFALNSVRNEEWFKAILRDGRD